MSDVRAKSLRMFLTNLSLWVILDLWCLGTEIRESVQDGVNIYSSRNDNAGCFKQCKFSAHFPFEHETF